MAITHEELVKDYIEELSAAKVEIMQWWDGLLRGSPEGLSLEENEMLIKRRWPAGPASHPRIIAIFRKYFFEVEKLNDLLTSREQVEDGSFRDETSWGEDEGIQEEGYIPPQALLLDQLETRAPELANLMKYFIYMPIGLDPDGIEC
jgi:hypothetical protein